jgi:hypothetical protein
MPLKSWVAGTIKSLLHVAISSGHWKSVHVNCELDNMTAIKYAECIKLGPHFMFYDCVEKSSLQLSYRLLQIIYNTEADSRSRHAWAKVE